jgi:hypothetical protein
LRLSPLAGCKYRKVYNFQIKLEEKGGR